jgi:hypothetical protein
LFCALKTDDIIVRDQLLNMAQGWMPLRSKSAALMPSAGWMGA